MCEDVFSVSLALCTSFVCILILQLIVFFHQLLSRFFLGGGVITFCFNLGSFHRFVTLFELELNENIKYIGLLFCHEWTDLWIGFSPFLFYSL